MTTPLGPVLTVAPAAKGVVMALMLAVLDVSFVKSLIIAAVSATLTGVFLLIATAWTVRATRANRDMLHDIKRKVGADQRKDDDGSAG